MGYEVVHEYEDVVSGDATTRPQLEAGLLAAHQRKFDVLLVWSIDRLSRERALVALDLLNKVEQTGVCFRSYAEQFLDSGEHFREAIVASTRILPLSTQCAATSLSPVTCRVRENIPLQWLVRANPASRNLPLICSPMRPAYQ